MTNLPSLPKPPSASSSLRRLRAPILLLAATLCAMLLFASGAGAEVVTVDGSTVGVAPRIGGEGPTDAKTFANPQGHPVLHSQNVFMVYWDPTDHVHGDWQEGIDEFLHDVGVASGGLSNVFSVLDQYDDKTNQPASYKDIFRGAYTDTRPYPTSGCTDPDPFEKPDALGAGETPVCISASQISTELQNFVTQHGLPRGMTTIYYLITPPGVGVCLDEGGAKGHCSDYEETEESYGHSFCSYHGDINPGGLPTGDANTILYGVIPFSSAGTYGDGHLEENDERPGWECQDGGIDPATFEAEPKRHSEEPNQIPCPDQYDGSCDHALFDLINNQISLEQENIVTDPLLNGWQDSDHAEAADECRFDFAPTIGGSISENGETFAGTLENNKINGMPVYLNDVFNLAGLRLPYPGVPCVKATNLEPKFTATNPVNAGEVVGFDGMESNITQNAGINFPGAGTPAATYATYTWNFGDGTVLEGYAPGAPVCEAPWLSPCAASAFHTYTYGGTYKVTLTVTDVGGNVAVVEHEITVVGPPPPASLGTSGSGVGSTGGALAVVVNPIASASIRSRSLKKALSKGLTVSYSVNEEVAGHFEVLIPPAVAKKLKLRGTIINGLPGDIGPQVLIAKAIIVTTKAGHSTVEIKFSKSVVARLRHAHKLSLLLQMYVRDAASKSPATTTVVSSVTLSG